MKSRFTTTTTWQEVTFGPWTGVTNGEQLRRRLAPRARWGCFDVDRRGAVDLAGFAIVRCAHTWPRVAGMSPSESDTPALHPACRSAHGRQMRESRGESVGGILPGLAPALTTSCVGCYGQPVGPSPG